jgi:hypothetical protein
MSITAPETTAIASTKNPCPAPAYESVFVCVLPAICDVISTYSMFIPLTVGVAVNVTTPVPVAYPVTVQFETIALDVFKNTAMFAAAKLAVLDPLNVSVCAVTAVPTAIAADRSVVCVMLDGSGYWYSDTMTCNAAVLVAYSPCTTPSGLVTRA